MFEYSLSDLAAQFGALPLPLHLWIGWLALICFVVPCLFIRRREARVILGLQACNLIFIVAIALAFGLVRLTSLAHVVFWTPMAVYAIRWIPVTERSSAFGLWLRVFALTVLVSLAMDYVDVARYLLGDRAIVAPGF